MADRPPISAIIATLGRPASLEETLRSLAAQTWLPAEVIVVHCGNDAATAEICARDWQPIRVRYWRSAHKGAALQRDYGVRLAAHDLILFADDDVVYDPAWIERLAGVVLADAAVGGAMGAVTNHPWSAPRPLWRVYRRLVATRQRARQPGAVIGALVPNGFPPDATAPIACEWLGGGVTLLRKSAYTSVNGFAGHYRGSSPGEDIDLGFRISRRWQLYYVPAARCLHDQSSTGRDDVANSSFQWMRSRYGFCRVSGEMSVPAAWWHLMLWALFQTLSEAAQLRRGRLPATVLAALRGRIRGAWSCVGWDPAADRFPEFNDLHGSV